MDTLAIPRRVLIVENDPGVRKTTAEVLELKGYQVWVAAGSGQTLLDDARRLLQSSRCHLAILDVRLFNDNDADDESGLEFAAEIAQRWPWVKCVFATGYGTFDVARRALSQNLAVDVAPKEVSEVIKTVQEAFVRHIRCRWDQRVEWVGGLREEDILSTVHHLRHVQEIDDEIVRAELIEVLGRLFPEADQLRVSRLAGNERSTSLGRSILLRVQPHQNNRWMVELAVKIADRPAIQRELDNYTHYVSGLIDEFRCTQQRAQAITWYMGSIAYALIGSNLDRVQTLREYYQQPNPNLIDDLDEIWQRLFRKVLRLWHSTADSSPINLWQEYHDVLELNEDRLQRLDWGNAARIGFDGLQRMLPNPVVWIKQHAVDSDVHVYQQVVHGDLHSRNIFVDSGKDVWLIDFERTGEGHCLRDYIELETDLKYGLLVLTERDMGLFASLELSLLAQDDKVSANRLRIPAIVDLHPDTRNAFSAIVRLRELAAARAQPDMRDYYWGLLCHTLFVATLTHLPQEAKRRAQLSSALICERLGDGHRLAYPWPPQDLLAPSLTQPDANQPAINIQIQQHVQTGGTHISGKEVDIGGDVVGRDKTD